MDLQVEEGEVFGFIGPNGAGKSTAIRTMLGLIYPTSGSSKIFGKDSLAAGPECAVRWVLTQRSILLRQHRVIDLLKYSASFYKKDCTKRMNELAEIMDLDLKKKIDDLSFGNKKKVASYRAFSTSRSSLS